MRKEEMIKLNNDERKYVLDYCEFNYKDECKQYPSLIKTIENDKLECYVDKYDYVFIKWMMED